MSDGCNDYLDMTGEEYNKLYARYIGRNLDRLILAAGPVEGKRVLDLCAGSGAVAVRAKVLGAAFVLAYDRSHTMMEGLEQHGINVSSEAHFDTDIFPYADHAPFDLVVCRQAVNYWWSFGGLVDVLKALKPGGCFIFNTFHGEDWKHPERPVTRQYEFGGLHYVETHWLVGDEVHHVQCCEGMQPHCTAFDYIPHDAFSDVIFEAKVLVKDFKVERRGNSDVYVVERA